ncbi:phosphatase PAP2 family protein [Brevibacillus sp. H7]|uniref:phosphatase PAP2 family protein n=1 Tax=Brevibacillus sp. H7 TaxID=3349138 RepID=UPI0037F4A464
MRLHPHEKTSPTRLLVWAGVFLALSLVLIALFYRNAYSSLDQLGFSIMETLRTPWLTVLMSAVTHMGGAEVLAPLGVLVVILFLVKGYRIEALIIACTLLIGDWLNDWLKELFVRPRPQGWNLIERPDSFSFPSGHAMVGLAFYGILAHFLRTNLAHAAYAAVIQPGRVLLVTLICASRVYLGVHYLSDVIAGLCMSAVWYCAVRYLYDLAVIRFRPQILRPVTPWK